MISIPDNTTEQSTEEPDKAKAFGYIRVSTDRQAKDGIGLDAQDKIVEDYFKQVIEPKGAAWGGVFIDAVSAFKKPFLQRPEAIRVMRELRQGDHLVIAKHDRAFRRSFDLADTYRRIVEERGINLHIVSMRFDSSDKTALIWGKCLLGMLTIFAELESEMMAQRQRDINAVRRLEGRAVSGKAPLGFKIVGERPKRRLVPDDEARETMMWIVEQVKQIGPEWNRISTLMVKQRIMWKRPDKKARIGYQWEFWDRWRVKNAYYRMIEILAAEEGAGKAQSP